MSAACVVAMAMIFSQPAVADKEWMATAMEAAFPFDGARYEGGDVHDPSITLFGDTYVMVCTSGRELAPVSTSRDLMKWQQHGSVMPEHPAWLRAVIPDHTSVWAPAPVRVGAALRIYYCASEKFGSNTSYIGLCEAAHFNPDHPTQGWLDKGKLIESKAGASTFNAIDPDVLIGPDGRHWMVFGSYWSGLYQVELDPQTGGLKHPEEKPLHVASNTAERGNPLEAPTMLFHNGYYYLVVTYGLAAQGVKSTYRMVCGRSQSPTDPFLGWDGKPMTEGGNTSLLKTSSPMFGPGGGNFFKDKKGEDWMAYHYYDSRRHWVRDMWGAPTMQTRRVVWGADGWPLPGLPAGVELRGHDNAEGDWTFQVDFGHIQTLSLEPGGAAKLGKQVGKWDLQGDLVRLRWDDPQAPNGAWTDSLHIDPTHQYMVGRNQAGVVVRAIKHHVQTAG